MFHSFIPRIYPHKELVTCLKTPCLGQLKARKFVVGVEKHGLGEYFLFVQFVSGGWGNGKENKQYFPIRGYIGASAGIHSGVLKGLRDATGWRGLWWPAAGISKGLFEPYSKLLVSPLITPMVVPYNNHLYNPI